MPEQFKDAMRMLAGAVTIITTGRGQQAAGLTATAVCSLSMEPPRLLICVNRFGSTYATLAESGLFCVNVLSAEQEPLAMAFAGRTGKAGVDKFAAEEWDHAQGSAPRHRAALAAVRCKVHSITLVDTHAIVIGDVTDTYMGPANASLIYRDQKFLIAS